MVTTATEAAAGSTSASGKASTMMSSSSKPTTRSPQVLMTQNHLDPVIKRKVKHLLSKTSGGRTQVLESLQEIGITTTTTSSESSSLKSALERTSAKSVARVLSDSERLVRDLERLDEDLRQVYELADSLDQAVVSARAKSEHMLADRSRLLESERRAKEQAEVLKAFNDLFSVSEEHLAALERAGGSGSSQDPAQDPAASAAAPPSGVVTSTFFEALERVQGVHSNCRLLLRGNHRRAGLALMDRMSSLQEKAYESLCRWVPLTGAALAEVEEEEAVGEDNLLHRAIAALRTRPVLLKYCAEEVASSRHNAFFRRFLDALTNPAVERERTSAPGSYVAKVAAWIRENCRAEERLLRRLFGPEGAGGAEEAGEDVLPLLDRAFEGICRPLETRVEQVLQAGSVGGAAQARARRQADLWRISWTLGALSGDLAGSLGPQSALAKTARACYERSAEAFRAEAAEGFARRLQPSSESSLDGELKQLAALLAETGDGPERAGDDPLERALAGCVAELCSFCERLADHQARAEPGGGAGAEVSLGGSAVEPGAARQRGGPAARRAIHQANALFRVVGALEGGGAARGAAVRSRASELLGGLAASCRPAELSETLERVGMYEQEGGGSFSAEISRDPALSPEALVSRLHGIHEYLLLVLRGEPDESLALLDLLAHPEARSLARRELLNGYAEAYDRLYRVLGAQGRSAQIQHKPDYVRDLVGSILA